MMTLEKFDINITNDIILVYFSKAIKGEFGI